MRTTTTRTMTTSITRMSSFEDASQLLFNGDDRLSERRSPLCPLPKPQVSDTPPSPPPTRSQQHRLVFATPAVHRRAPSAIERMSRWGGLAHPSRGEDGAVCQQAGSRPHAGYVISVWWELLLYSRECALVRSPDLPGESLLKLRPAINWTFVGQIRSRPMSTKIEPPEGRRTDCMRLGARLVDLYRKANGSRHGGS